MISITTADGSDTLKGDVKESYHSRFGALSESRRVFIDLPQLSLRMRANRVFRIFEAGFGSGLNFRLTAVLAQRTGCVLDYHACDLSPLSFSQITQLNHRYLLIDSALNALIAQALDCRKNGVQTRCQKNYSLTLYPYDIKQINLKNDHYDHISFDLFSPRQNDHLWSLAILQKCFDSLLPGGTFSTYCCRGQLQRDLKSVGFDVHTHPGPPGKREILLAKKPGHMLI